MAAPPDELDMDVNSFYRFLQANLREKFEKAQDTGYLICLPQSQSLVGVPLTLKFTDYHILKPSPYFQSQYLTSHSKEKTVILENGQLVTGDGFPSTERVKIIDEELCYNKTYKPYKILIIERPLDPSVQMRTVVPTDTGPDITFKYSFEECEKLLSSYSNLKDILRKLDEDTDKFMRNYIILKDCLNDASKRLQGIAAASFERCVLAQPKLQTDARLAEMIHIAVDSYTIGRVHNKIYPIIRERYRHDDDSLRQKLEQLKTLTSEELGIQSQFICSHSQTIEELNRLGTLQTTYDKLNCIHQTLECIKADITNHHQRNCIVSTKSKEKLLFTSDDLIPILTRVLSECDCRHLSSDIFYIENFTWSLSSKHEFSFCLATLKAAVEYSKSVNIHTLQVKYSTMEHKKQDSNINKTTSSGVNLKSDITLSTGRYSSASKRDRDLDKMARLLQESTASLNDSLNKTRLTKRL